jgi:imidazole glycerol phosphate synthase glutamine amidotransferase subunit
VHVIVTVIDHGLSNLGSLVSALTHLGHETRFAQSTGDIEGARVLILPGVGSFPVAMEALSRKGYGEEIRAAATGGNSKILGICLGMQLLLSSSDEGAGARGLNLVEGVLERFQESGNLPIPHIGFNGVRAPINSELFAGLPPESDFYFVHSHRARAVPPGVTAATTVHGEAFISAFEAGNVYGVQFHPEKSQGNGLRLLSNFLAAEVK